MFDIVGDRKSDSTSEAHSDQRGNAPGVCFFSRFAVIVPEGMWCIMKVTDRRKKEKLKLDQMMRVLFRLSKRLTVQLISGLFGEQFATEDVK
jgi:hypothetical protein